MRIRELELSNFTTNANYAFSIEGQGGRGRDGEKKNPEMDTRNITQLGLS